MNLLLKLPSTESQARIDCNDEELLFKGEKTSVVWVVINQFFSSPNHTISEANYLTEWLNSGGLPTSAKSQMSQTPTILSDSIVIREISAFMHSKRHLFSEVSERNTFYKHLFSAALFSMRDFDKVIQLVDLARKTLEIDQVAQVAMVDALLTARKDFEFDINSLTPEEKEVILAISFMILNADERKHLFELSICRSIMVSLSLLDVSNKRLGALTQLSVTELVMKLSERAKTIALLNSFRMAVADGLVHSAEREIFREIVGLVPFDQVKFLRKITALETAKKIAI